MIDVSGDSLYGLRGRGEQFGFHQILCNFPLEVTVV